MRLRAAIFFLLLFAFARTSFAADAVRVQVSHYTTAAEPAWVEVTAHNNTNGR